MNEVVTLLIEIQEQGIQSSATPVLNALKWQVVEANIQSVQPQVSSRHQQIAVSEKEALMGQDRAEGDMGGVQLGG